MEMKREGAGHRSARHLVNDGLDILGRPPGSRRDSHWIVLLSLAIQVNARTYESSWSRPMFHYNGRKDGGSDVTESSKTIPLPSVADDAARGRGDDVRAVAGGEAAQSQRVIAVGQMARDQCERDEHAGGRAFEARRVRCRREPALERFENRVESSRGARIGHLELQPDLRGIARNPQDRKSVV